MASLSRDRDGEGFSGSRVEALDSKTLEVVGHEPIVGCRLLVGSMTAGMFSSRDWWCTTAITEIIEETEDKIRFKTGNSIYTLER